MLKSWTTLVAAAALALPLWLVGCSGDADEAGDPVDATPEQVADETPEATPEPTPDPTPEEALDQDERAARIGTYLATFADEDRAKANPLSGDADAIAKGQEEFDSTCFPCHGREGKGDGPAAAAMGIKPIDHTDAERGAQITDGERFLILKHGIPETAMQPFGAALSDDQVWRIIAYVETLRAPPAEAPAPAE
jgi:mono/diheme cytochrome c family protein